MKYCCYGTKQKQTKQTNSSYCFVLSPPTGFYSLCAAFSPLMVSYCLHTNRRHWANHPTLPLSTLVYGGTCRWVGLRAQVSQFNCIYCIVYMLYMLCIYATSCPVVNHRSRWCTCRNYGLDAYFSPSSKVSYLSSKLPRLMKNVICWVNNMAPKIYIIQYIRLQS